MTENEVSYKVIGVCLKLHSALRPGLLESAHEETLTYNLKQEGFDIKRQVSMPLEYKDIQMDIGYLIDLLINNKVILELKSLETLAPVHFAQTLTYLKLSELKLALLIILTRSILKMVFIA